MHHWPSQVSMSHFQCTPSLRTNLCTQSTCTPSRNSTPPQIHTQKHYIYLYVHIHTHTHTYRSPEHTQIFPSSSWIYRPPPTTCKQTHIETTSITQRNTLWILLTTSYPMNKLGDSCSWWWIFTQTVYMHKPVYIYTQDTWKHPQQSVHETTSKCLTIYSE